MSRHSWCAFILCERSRESTVPCGATASPPIFPVACSSVNPYLVSWASLQSQSMHQQASSHLHQSVQYCILMPVASISRLLASKQLSTALCVFCRCALCVFPAVADIVSVAFTTLFLVALLTTTRRMITAAINRRIQRRLRIFQSVTVSSESQHGLKCQLSP